VATASSETGTRRVWVAPEAGLLAREAGDGVVIEDLSAFTQSVLTGTVADDFRAAAEGGAVAPESRGRLEALGRAGRPVIAHATTTLLQGAFRPATPADVLRRDGWGQLWIELTAQCNERCVHCYAESAPERTESLDRSVVLQLIDDAAALGFLMVQFTGGDPLLCPFLVEAAAHARARGLAVEVYTNGLALTPELLGRLREHDAAFAFSIYGDRPAEHDAVTRVPGSHARTSDAIRRAVAAGGPVRVAIIVMAENRDRVEAAIDHVTGLGVDRAAVGADVMHAAGRGEFDAAVTIPEQANLAEGTHRGMPGTPDADPYAAGAAPAAPVGHHAAANPRRGRLAIGPEGQVWPCIFTRWAEMGRVGPDRRLADVLAGAQPAPSWNRPSCLDTADRSSLQCGECRVAAAALTTLAGGAP
jgi:MoaA/NifB/PqqE/SkfB family radical SAM enzyme